MWRGGMTLVFVAPLPELVDELASEGTTAHSAAISAKTTHRSTMRLRLLM
jgi:hypothetical protein